MPRYRVRDFGTSLANVSAAERELAASIAGGKRYPDRAALRGKVRRMTRQREARERAEQRTADRSWSDLSSFPSVTA